MKPFTCKKRYLLKTPKEAIALLSMASTSIKESIYFIYSDENFGVISFHFQSEKDARACEAALIEYIIKDVSTQKRYKKRYLEQFGLPEAYDFDLDAVFGRLESLGETSFHFAFHQGMSTQNVLKVLLYRALIRFELAMEGFGKETHTQESIIKRMKSMMDVLKLWQSVFDPFVIERTLERFKTLRAIVSDEEKEVLLALMQTENYRLMMLDISYLLFEESDFYALKDIPLGAFVVKQKGKLANNKALKKLKKSFYM